MREPEGKLAGFSCVLEPEWVTQERAGADPVMHNWMEHLQAVPILPHSTPYFTAAGWTGNLVKLPVQRRRRCGSISNAPICSSGPAFDASTRRQRFRLCRLTLQL